MVEGTSGIGDSPAVPTIAELLLEYRRATGASYIDMSRSLHGEITPARLHQLSTEPPASFPRHPHTVQLLADLLQVPIPTILDAFAKALGLHVVRSDSLLSITLPPGTDNLTAEDLAAIRAITRQLVEARRRVVPTPDLDSAEGFRLAEHETAAEAARDTNRNGTVR